MASDKESISPGNGEKDALELINTDLYQMLVRQAAHDRRWSPYFLLVNTCCQIAKQVPTTRQACEQEDVDLLLADALEKIGETINTILPGGSIEFAEYIPSAATSNLPLPRRPNRSTCPFQHPRIQTSD